MRFDTIRLPEPLSMLNPHPPMKTHPFTARTLVLLAALLVTTGCPKKNQPQVLLAETTAPALAEPPSSPNNVSPPQATVPVTVAAPDLFKEMNAALEAATPEKHEGLAAVQQRMDREIDNRISAWKSAGNNVSLAQDEKLDTATEDFAEKLRLLTLSSPEVWETAKHNTVIALQNVRSAYAGIINKPAVK
jgi:hypothetical protein